MRILLDTNVVLRLGDLGHAMHGEALTAIRTFTPAEVLDGNLVA